MQHVELQLDVAALAKNSAETMLSLSLDAWFTKSFTWSWPEKSSINLLKFHALLVAYIASQFCAVGELNVKSPKQLKVRAVLASCDDLQTKSAQPQIYRRLFVSKIA